MRLWIVGDRSDDVKKGFDLRGVALFRAIAIVVIGC